MCLLVLALKTVFLISVDLLGALLDHRLVQCGAAAHGGSVPKTISHSIYIVKIQDDSLLMLLELLGVERV